MNSPNDKGEGTPTGHLITQSKHSSTGIGFHSFEMITKVSHGNTQTTWAVAKKIDCASQTDSNAPLLKTTHPQLNERGVVQLIPTLKFHPHILVSIT